MYIEKEYSPPGKPKTSDEPVIKEASSATVTGPCCQRRALELER